MPTVGSLPIYEKSNPCSQGRSRLLLAAVDTLRERTQANVHLCCCAVLLLCTALTAVRPGLGAVLPAARTVLQLPMWATLCPAAVAAAAERSACADVQRGTSKSDPAGAQHTPS
jgi:hypothetical protein